MRWFLSPSYRFLAMARLHTAKISAGEMLTTRIWVPTVDSTYNLKHQIKQWTAKTTAQSWNTGQGWIRQLRRIAIKAITSMTWTSAWRASSSGSLRRTSLRETPNRTTRNTSSESGKDWKHHHCLRAPTHWPRTFWDEDSRHRSESWYYRTTQFSPHASCRRDILLTSSSSFFNIGNRMEEYWTKSDSRSWRVAFQIFCGLGCSGTGLQTSNQFRLLVCLVPFSTHFSQF